LPGKKTIKLPAFAPPTNAATINTPENEMTPFFFAPSQKLYFSSDGWPGLGGYDIFKSNKKGDAFTPPENIGAGLNTSYNDLYFYLKPDGVNGYLSSNRPGSFYLDESNKTCCNDLYSFILPKAVLPVKEPPKDSTQALVAKTPIPTLPVTPKVATPTSSPEPKTLQDFTGLPLYFDNDEPDKRTNRTTTRKNYDETAQTYLEKQAEYREQFSLGLKGTKQEAAENQIDNFFDNEVRRGYDRLAQLCEMLLTRLQHGDHIEVIVKGFTSPRAKSDYNLNLGKRRVSSVRNQFSAYGDGALESYIRSGQLKVLETSFGETTAKAGISDDLKDLRNSVYHPDAARERRVEIVEIHEKD
jgi:outer membrane protein OmpA-like peptidoglycan-associated protein